MIRHNERNGRRRLLLAVLLIASIALVTVDYRSHGSGPLAKAGRGIASVLNPLQEGLGKIFGPVGDFFAGFTKVRSLRSQVKKLEQENGLLRQQQGQVEDIRRENERLRALLEMRRRVGLKVLEADVIAVAPSNFEHSVVIDQGSAEGVRKNMPVIGPGGLIGRVMETTAHAARVMLVSDPSSSVAGRLAPSGISGLLTGTAGSELRFEIFDTKGTISVGDSVVTSGYQRSVYPPGIPIGSVTRVDVHGLVRIAWVQPAADLGTLDYVLVVTQGTG